MIRNIKARLRTGSLGRVEDGAQVIYKPGTEFLISAEELETHGDRLEVLGGAVLAPDPEEAEHVEEVRAATVASAPSIRAAFDDDEAIVPADHWATAKKQVQDLEDIDAVRAFLAAEEAGKARDSVIEAAEARRAELGG